MKYTNNSEEFLEKLRRNYNCALKYEDYVLAKEIGDDIYSIAFEDYKSITSTYRRVRVSLKDSDDKEFKSALRVHSKNLVSMVRKSKKRLLDISDCLDDLRDLG